MSPPTLSASGQPRTIDRRLIVLRHGVTEHNRAGIWQGHLDTDLSPRGYEQAAAAAGELTAYTPFSLLSSDLRRASETAAAIAASTSLPLRTDPRLREISVGAWQGLTNADVEALSPGMQARVAAGEDVRRGETGENVAEVAVRARAAVDDFLSTLPAGEVGIVVTHGVAARALVADMIGMDQRTAWVCLSGLGNCHWAELREHDGRWRLFGWNHCAPDPEGGASAWQMSY